MLNLIYDFAMGMEEPPQMVDKNQLTKSKKS